MPINDIDHRARTLGRIRAGEFDEDANRPTAGKFWRLTSPHRRLLDAAAAVYGGTVEPLDRRDTDDNFQLTTEAEALDVIIPPQDVRAGQWYETYTAAGLVARCDGNVIIEGDFLNRYDGDQFPPPCQCNPEARKCKPTTRLNVIIPNLPDVGVWRLTTRSIYAAAEIPAQLDFLFRRAQFPQAILALEERSTKTGSGVHRFTVPIIALNVTLESILAGEGTPTSVGALGGGETAPPAPGSLAPAAGVSPPPQISAVEASDYASQAPPEASAADTPEKTPTPLERNLGALAAFLADNHPYQVHNDDGLIEFVTRLYALGEPVGVWRGQDLDSLAVSRLKAFRGDDASEALDVAGDTFPDRARGVELAELKTFATRLWMECQTFVDTKGRP